MYLKDYSFLYIPSNEKMLYYIILFVWKEKDLELIWFNFKPILKNSNWNGVFGCIKMFYAHVYLKGYSFMYIPSIWENGTLFHTYCVERKRLWSYMMSHCISKRGSTLWDNSNPVLLILFLNLDSLKLSLEAEQWEHLCFDYIFIKKNLHTL
jgi:hypothetical protein